MALSHQEFVDHYQRGPKYYDFTTQLYYLAGFRVWT
jgi:hypothetical protein